MSGSEQVNKTQKTYQHFGVRTGQQDIKYLSTFRGQNRSTRHRTPIIMSGSEHVKQDTNDISTIRSRNRSTTHHALIEMFETTIVTVICT